MNAQIVSALVFILVFTAIVLEKADKTLLVLLGALFLIVGGYIGFEEALHSVDFNTILLLMSMMILVEGLRELRFFDLFALKLAVLTRANPVWIFIIGGLSSAVFSAFLDNVTTVLVIIPIIFALIEGVGLPPKPYILSIIFLSNIGGTATLIGDPPNILIGTQVKELTFLSFLQYLTLPVVLSAAAVLYYMKWANKQVIRPRRKRFSWFFIRNLILEDLTHQQREIMVDYSSMRKSMFIFLLVVIGFFLHSFLSIEPSVIALGGAVFLLIWLKDKLDIHKLFSRVEWPTLLFFAGLFVIVGSMEKSGFLHLIAVYLTGVTDQLWVLILIVLWSSAIFSAVVDNIPFVAVMIPIIKTLLADTALASDPKSYLLWWALALGACFGGNGTLIGASANVVGCAVARSHGVEIAFKEFLKTSLKVTLISLCISTIYLMALYVY